MQYTQFVPNKTWERKMLRDPKLYSHIKANTKHIEEEMEQVILNSKSGKTSGKDRSPSTIYKSNEWFSRLGKQHGKKNFGSYTKQGRQIPFGVVFMRARKGGLTLKGEKMKSLLWYEESHAAFEKTLKKFNSTPTKKGKDAIW